jgi:hypothetical protein
VVLGKAAASAAFGTNQRYAERDAINYTAKKLVTILGKQGRTYGIRIRSLEECLPLPGRWPHQRVVKGFKTPVQGQFALLQRVGNFEPLEHFSFECVGINQERR